MTINGNYDARVSNPFLNGAGITGGVSRTDKIEVFPPSGVSKTDENPWGVSLTPTATPKTRAAGVVATVGEVLEGMTDTEDEANVTDFYSSYITPGTNIAAASFNASMALSGFEEAYEKMA